MFQKFYGLTAINLVMSSMPIKLYVNCVENLKNEKEVLTLFRKQLDSMETFLTNIPSEYKDIQAKRSYGKLNRLLRVQPDSPEIEELRKFLATQEVTIAHFVNVGTGENMKRVDLSETSISILSYLKGKMDAVTRYKQYLNVTSELDKEVYFFNQPLYNLKMYQRPRLIRLLGVVLRTHSSKGNLTPQFWEFVDKFTSYVLEHVSEEEDVSYDVSEDVVTEVDDFISNLGYDYFNLVLGKNYSEEEYHKASLELYEIGLIGFTPFVQEMYSEFKTSFKHNYEGELHVSKDSPLYKFVIDLRRALDSNLEIGEGLNSESILNTI